MTSNSITENEEKDIPSHILKTIFGSHASVIFRPKYVWFPAHLKGPMIPDHSGQLAELIVEITSTRVDLYSHQILLVNIFEMTSIRHRINSKWMPFKTDILLQMLTALYNVIRCGVVCSAMVSFHIEAETKWTPFRRRHIQMHFREWKCMNFD